MRLASTTIALALASLAALWVVGRGPPPPSFAAPTSAALVATPIASGFVRPLDVVAAPDDPSTLYVVEKRGVVRVLEDGRIRPQPFLDLRNAVSTLGERGLLAIVFDPAFARNGFVYVDPALVS